MQETSDARREKIMIQVYSEIGDLKKVMVHKPGNELLQVYPFDLANMLFEDTPYLPEAQREHDLFTDILREQNVEVVYFRDLLESAFSDPSVRKKFIKDFTAETHFPAESLKNRAEEYYETLTAEELVEAALSGIRSDHEFFSARKNLADHMTMESLFLVDPLPNTYFVRDSSVNIADGVILSKMAMPFRKRESLLFQYIHKYAEGFAENPTTNYYDRSLPFSIEGGDVAILSDKVVFIGCTERTEVGAIEYVADSLLKKGFEGIYAFEFEKTREQMHLDGMLTMIDYDTFLVHPLLNGNVRVFKVSGRPGNVQIESMLEEWDVIIKKALNLDHVNLIPCGSGDPIQGIWDYWNLGANVLAIRPGEVVGYDRTPITLELLDRAGIKIHTFKGGELSRGRGGARCMSMPMIREKI